MATFKFSKFAAVFVAVASIIGVNVFGNKVENASGNEILNRGPTKVLFAGNPIIYQFANAEESVIASFSVPK